MPVRSENRTENRQRLMEIVEVVRRHDARHIGYDAAFALADQDADNTRRNIANIRRTRLHIAVIHRREHLRELCTRVADGGFGVHAVVLDHALDALNKIQVLQHHLVRLEDSCIFLADLLQRLII